MLVANRIINERIAWNPIALNEMLQAILSLCESGWEIKLFISDCLGSLK
ncbi:hypothetical protein [Desulfurococcus amylolyticus]|nr:hypothetical protein [Desulfurococcus amylolyticus]